MHAYKRWSNDQKDQVKRIKLSEKDQAPISDVQDGREMLAEIEAKREQ